MSREQPTAHPKNGRRGETPASFFVGPRRRDAILRRIRRWPTRGSEVKAMQEACQYLLTVERMFKHQNWEVRAREARKRRLALKRAINSHRQHQRGSRRW